MKNNTTTDYKTINFPYAEKLIFEHPKETFPITNASSIALKAISKNYKLLKGIGIDWGCGCGCLGIHAAKIAQVNRIFGLDINEKNISISHVNSIKNDITEKCSFYRSDSFIPYKLYEKEIIDANKGKIDFILANPPSSPNDDGFSFRRLILNQANEYLSKDGVIFLNVSSQYGIDRISELNSGPYFFGNILESTDWEEFDLHRADLYDYIKNYIKEENESGCKYEFFDTSTKKIINANDALEKFRKNGEIPHTKWQVYIFKRKK